jgi:hypothetical protein
MSILLVVVPNFLVCKRLVRLGEFDPVVVYGFEGLILCWIWSNLIRMEFGGEVLVVRFDFLLGGRLFSRQITSRMHRTRELTSESPRISYGFHIFGTVRAVTMIK